MHELIGKTTAEAVTYLLAQSPLVETLGVRGYRPYYGGYDNPAQGPVKYLGSEQLGPFWLEQAQKLIDGRYPLTCLISKVMVDGETRHIPMLDSVGRAVSKLKEVLNDLRLPEGVIADSGNGLHYLGMQFIDQYEFDQVVNRCAAFVQDEHPRYEQIEADWVRFCQKNGFASLRMDTEPQKPTTPTIIDLYEPDHSKRRLAVPVVEKQLALWPYWDKGSWEYAEWRAFYHQS